MAVNLRNAGAVDQRRLGNYVRQYYRPGKAIEALSRVKNFKANWAYDNNKEIFRTEQKPGSGGFQAGSDVQAQRNFDIGTEKERNESFRPQENVPVLEDGKDEWKE